MPPHLPLLPPPWHEGQSWSYELVRTGRDAFTGRLIYTARRVAEDRWRIEGASDYPAGRTLQEWLEVGGQPTRPLAAAFERQSPSGHYRYTAEASPDGGLSLEVETNGVRREEHHDGRRGAVYIGNQLDFLLQCLDLESGDRWPLRLRVEDGRIFPGEARLVGREVPLTVDDETVPATLLTVRGGPNALVRALSPTLRYWFHPRDRSMLLRLESGETTLTLVEAS